ncbi:MAG: tryptophan--tRNA ligase, partial [Saprospiraceae bacterium]
LKASNKLEDHRSLLADYESGQLKYSMLKEAVAEGIIEMSAPFKLKLAEIKADQENVTNQILDSSAIIRKRAQETMRDVRELTGLPSLR